MRKPGEAQGIRTLAPVLLALTVAVLAAILLAGQVAEAQRGGGGGGRGGGGGGKPSGSAGKPSGYAKNASVEKGLPPGVADPKSPYYNSPRYGVRHGALSNFFLWSWLFHDHDDDEYEEEYVESNTSSGGWLITVIGLVAVVGLPIWLLRRRAGG